MIKFTSKQTDLTKFNCLELLTIILAILCCCCCCCAQTDSDFTYFGNMGPDHWSEHFNLCSGKHQSPININDLDVVNRNFTKMNYKEFGKSPVDATLYNNGHTVLVKITYDGEIPTITGGPLDGLGTYQFQQLHFHWGEDNTVGSEDRINDVVFPMELHVVFRNTKYQSFEVAAREDDGVAVLAAFYKVGNYTTIEYDHLTSYLEHIYEPHTNFTLKKPMDLFSLLTADLNQYYTYIGSLTTPPCSEDVLWIDYLNPIVISTEMIERFRFLKTFDGSSLSHNFRPVQPLNNRKVYRAASGVSETTTKLDNLANCVSTLTGMKSAVFSILFIALAMTKL